MSNNKILPAGSIVNLTDYYGEDSVMCLVLAPSVDLQHEQEVYDRLNNYAICCNSECDEYYKINSDGPKFCPHCGQGLHLEQQESPSVSSFFEALRSKGLVKRYIHDVKCYNTQY